MHDQTLIAWIFRKPQFIPLRYRFIFTTSCMLVFLLGSLALIIGFLQSRTIRSQLEGRGLSIAQSLAAASISNLLTYNYVALERLANQAALDPEIIQVIFHDKEGRVAGFNGRADLQNTFLDDTVSRKALATRQPLIQEISKESDKVQRIRQSKGIGYIRSGISPRHDGTVGNCPGTVVAGSDV
jgi:two-component system sensor histidine kinase AtoS